MWLNFNDVEKVSGFQTGDLKLRMRKSRLIKHRVGRMGIKPGSEACGIF